MNHLALEVFSRDLKSSQYANLPDNASITLIITSEIFDSGNIWSYDFTLNILANLHIFGTSGELHGSRLHEQIDKRRARLWVEGLPLYYGYLRLGDEVEVDENGDVDISFESGQKTFQDMIDGGKANQVPLLDDILIGMAVDRERTLHKKNVFLYYSHYNIAVYSRPCLIDMDQDGPVQMYPKFVRPDGTWYKQGTEQPFTLLKNELINTDYPYDEKHPYCNTRICYTKQKYTQDGDSVTKSAERDYRVKEPRSINPAPNFYVLYWIKCLMKHLGINIEENQMMDVEDLRRLFFVNTKCSYTTKEDPNEIYKDHTSGGKNIYLPLGPGVPVVPPNNGDDDPNYKLEVTEWVYIRDGFDGMKKMNFKFVTMGECEEIEQTWQKAYASNGCFPASDISDVISAIENGFGVRFLFNEDYTKVRVVLLRNILRSREVHEITCDVSNVTKSENSIRGFRLTYGAGADNTDYNYKGFIQAKINQEGKWVDDTDDHDYTQFNMEYHYANITEQVGSLNKTCYVDGFTGNSYIIKIDKDEKDPDNWNPSLIECAEFIDAEDGDCTGEEETIKEIKAGFSPIVVNTVKRKEGDGSSEEASDEFYALFVDVEMGVPCIDIDMDNTASEIQEIMKDSLSVIKDSDGQRDMSRYSSYFPSGYNPTYPTVTKQEPKYQSGLFEVATMTRALITADGSDEIKLYGGGTSGAVLHMATAKFKCSIRDGYRLYLQDNYNISDDLLIPIEEHDWGLSFGIMRGSGSNAYVDYESDPDDSEGNDTWDIVSGGNATAHHDTCDNYGNIYEYATVVPGQDGYTGYQFGDKLLHDYGCQNNCNLKTQKAYGPNDSRARDKIKTYSAAEKELLILTEQGYYAIVVNIQDASGVNHKVWLSCVSSNNLQPYGNIEDVVASLTYPNPPANAAELLSRDSSHTYPRIIAVDPKEDTIILMQACQYYLKGNEIVHSYSDDRVSLKLRAEKPNPNYAPGIPNIIKTKEDAALAMTKLYTTSDADLLNRPKVPNATMRAAGWNAPGDGYATVYSIGYGVLLNDGVVHEILWSPIKPDGTVKTQEQLQSYVNSFNRISFNKIKSHDTEHLILDINTTEERAELLHKLQAVYYAEDGEDVDSVNISSINTEYLKIANPLLRHRGLADQFYKEYSYWVRNARIASMTLKMELAQLLGIDMTVRQQMGDITGFVKKMQVTFSNKTGMGDVETEVWYL